MGYGSMLLRHPNSESEANFVPADSKSYVTSESYLGPASFILHNGSNGVSNSNAAFEKLMWSLMRAHESARRDKLDYSKQRILENVDSALVAVPVEENHRKEVGGRGNVGGAFRDLTKSTMRSLKRPHGSQLQSFTDADVRGGTMEKASSRSGAMASSQLRMPKSGNATRGGAVALNLFKLPPNKLLSMMAHPDKDCDQDSLLLEVPLNARHPEAELLRCCPPPSQLSSVPLTAASPPSYQSQLR